MAVHGCKLEFAIMCATKFSVTSLIQHSVAECVEYFIGQDIGFCSTPGRMSHGAYILKPGSSLVSLPFLPFCSG